MPIFRYFIFVGFTLAGLLVAFEAMTGSRTVEQVSADSTTAASSSSRSSIDLLRKMSHHGEGTSTALAAAGPMLPMPALPTQVAPREPRPVVAGTHADAAETPTVAAASPSTLDAQARLAADDVVHPKPVKKRVALRKPHNNRYVENTQRGPFDFFGSVQSW